MNVALRTDQYELTMLQGRRLPAGSEGHDRLRERVDEEVRRLPERIRGLDAAAPPHEVNISAALERYTEQVTRQLARRADSNED